jgi:hypothetical protein
MRFEKKMSVYLHIHVYLELRGQHSIQYYPTT